ncbi:MAG: hypothetical protein MJZ24_11185 [Paludibacteraceae bacterium]|nr:hypothetical protein [Paludibacteraceae bacterium]
MNLELDPSNQCIAEILLITFLETAEQVAKDFVLNVIRKFPKLCLGSFVLRHWASLDLGAVLFGDRDGVGLGYYSIQSFHTLLSFVVVNILKNLR